MDRKIKIFISLQLIIILSCNSTDEYVYFRKDPFKDSFRIIEKKDHIEYDERFCKIKKSNEFPIDAMIKYGNYAVNIKGKIRYEIIDKSRGYPWDIYNNCDENIQDRMDEFLLNVTKRFALNILPLFELSTLSEPETFQNALNENLLFGEFDLSNGKIKYCFDDNERLCANHKKRNGPPLYIAGIKKAQSEIDKIYVYPM